MATDVVVGSAVILAPASPPRPKNAQASAGLRFPGGTPPVVPVGLPSTSGLLANNAGYIFGTRKVTTEGRAQQLRAGKLWRKHKLPTASSVDEPEDDKKENCANCGGYDG
jgi:hypothetical protein